MVLGVTLFCYLPLFLTQLSRCLFLYLLHTHTGQGENSHLTIFQALKHKTWPYMVTKMVNRKNRLRFPTPAFYSPQRVPSKESLVIQLPWERKKQLYMPFINHTKTDKRALRASFVLQKSILKRCGFRFVVIPKYVDICLLSFVDLLLLCVIYTHTGTHPYLHKRISFFTAFSWYGLAAAAAVDWCGIVTN